MSRLGVCIAALVSLSSLSGHACLHAQSPPRVGGEFQVNSHTLSDQRYIAMGLDDDGDFVVTWMSLNQDNDGNGIFARRFDSAGAPVAAEFQVNIRTINNQRYPAIAVGADGDFIIVWHGLQAVQDVDSYAVVARRFDSAGAPQTGELVVNTYTTGSQWFPAIAMNDDGDFVVTWESTGQDGSDKGVFAQRFSSAGTRQASEFQMNSYTTGLQRFPDVAIDDDGDFVVTWQSWAGQDGAYGGIFAQRVSAAGGLQGAEFQVNTYTSFFQNKPVVAMHADGDFIIAWESYGDRSGYGIFAQKFDSAGAPQAVQFQVNVFTNDQQRNAAIATDRNGEFVVTWDSKNQDQSAYGTFARRLYASGTPQASEFQVNSFTALNQRLPAVAVSADHRFVIAWQSNEQDGGTEGVFAQRFLKLAVLDIDGDGMTVGLTDGVLALRSMFGFTGTVLTSGAVGGGCSRCDAAAISPYLAGLGSVLDVDGNTTVRPLTDGLLAARFLIGFTDTALTSGAVGSGCTRCDAAAIEAYLQPLI